MCRRRSACPASAVIHLHIIVMGGEEMASSMSQLGVESQNDSTTLFVAMPRTGVLSQAAFRRDRPKKFQIMLECTDANAQPLLSNSGRARVGCRCRGLLSPTWSRGQHRQSS